MGLKLVSFIALPMFVYPSITKYIIIFIGPNMMGRDTENLGIHQIVNIQMNYQKDEVTPLTKSNVYHVRVFK